MNFLKQYRKEKGIIQQEASKMLGISLRAYRSYEQGKRTIPTEIFIKILEDWKNYPNRERIIEVLKWYENERKIKTNY